MGYATMQPRPMIEPPKDRARNGQTEISVRNLDLFYGTFQALKGVNLDIREKAITALIGPSGCGKSTFLRTLNRMNDLIPGVRVSGSIQLAGEEIYAKPENRR